MKKGWMMLASCTLLLMFGCATQQIQQGKNLSTSGIAYTEAVDNLLSHTSDRLIEFNNAELKKARRGSNPKEIITEHNQAVLGVISEIEAFRAQSKLLKVYFINLQALADSPVKDDFGGAVKSLSDSISKLNMTIGGEDGKASLTEAQKMEIGALAGLVANSIHAAKIKNALKRDAEVIGTYLLLQEKQLKTISEILKDRFQAENELFLNEKVIAPYVNRDKPIGSQWEADRTKWIKTHFVSQRLDTAQVAAEQLRGVWADILQGNTDIDSLSILISDVNEFVVTVQALKDASAKDD